MLCSSAAARLIAACTACTMRQSRPFPPQGTGAAGAPCGVARASSAANLARLGRDQELRKLQVSPLCLSRKSLSHVPPSSEACSHCLVIAEQQVLECTSPMRPSMHSLRCTEVCWCDLLWAPRCGAALPPTKPGPPAASVGPPLMVHSALTLPWS